MSRAEEVLADVVDDFVELGLERRQGLSRVRSICQHCGDEPRTGRVQSCRLRDRQVGDELWVAQCLSHGIDVLAGLFRRQSVFIPQGGAAHLRFPARSLR